MIFSCNVKKMEILFLKKGINFREGEFLNRVKIFVLYRKKTCSKYLLLHILSTFAVLNQNFFR